MKAQLLLVSVILSSCSGPDFKEEDVLPWCPLLKWGVHSSDVSQDSVVLWTSTADSKVRFSIKGPDGLRTTDAQSVKSNQSQYFLVSELHPDTQYEYELHREGCKPLWNDYHRGRFKTLPAPNHPKPLKLLWGADIGGQEFCRKKDSGYPIFKHLTQERADLFIGAGDMIYADSPCTEKQNNIPLSFAAAETPEQFREKFLYNFADTYYRDFLSRQATIATWDDHEVRDNFGKDNPLTRIGFDAFLDAFPAVTETGEINERIYRSRSLGALADLFVLDTRSYRDSTLMKDGPKKTMLGDHQLSWLLKSLRESKATWKIVLCSVPIATPTGYPAEQMGRDGWSNYTPSNWAGLPGANTGYEFEFSKIYKLLQDQGITNVIFLTADAHRAMATEYRSRFNKIVLREFMSGPLSAVPLTGDFLDQTFHPKLLFHQGNVMNYGVLEVGAQELVVRLVDEQGKNLYRGVFKAE